MGSKMEDAILSGFAFELTEKEGQRTLMMTLVGSKVLEQKGEARAIASVEEVGEFRVWGKMGAKWGIDIANTIAEKLGVEATNYGLGLLAVIIKKLVQKGVKHWFLDENLAAAVLTTKGDHANEP